MISFYSKPASNTIRNFHSINVVPFILLSTFLFFGCSSEPECFEIKNINFTIGGQGEDVLFYKKDFDEYDFTVNKNNPQYCVFVREGEQVLLKYFVDEDSICRKEWSIYRFGTDGKESDMSSDAADYTCNFNELGTFEVKLRVNNETRYKLVQVIEWGTPIPDGQDSYEDPDPVAEVDPIDRTYSPSKEDTEPEEDNSRYEEEPIDETPQEPEEKPFEEERPFPNPQVEPEPEPSAPVDSDGDGVIDSVDDCPGVKGTPANYGCPPEPPPPPKEKAKIIPPVVPSGDDDWYAMNQNNRIGIRYRDRCAVGTSDVNWTNGQVNIGFSPKRKMELERFRVYASDNGRLKITLTYNSGGQTHSPSITKRVNLGKSDIELTDLSVIMHSGITYTMTIQPIASGNSAPQLDNIVNCSPSAGGNADLSIDYKNNYVIFDLTYGY